MTCGSHYYRGFNLKSLLDHSLELWSLLFLQKAKTSNLTNKNKEVVGVALSCGEKIEDDIYDPNYTWDPLRIVEIWIVWNEYSVGTNNSIPSESFANSSKGLNRVSILCSIHIFLSRNFRSLLVFFMSHPYDEIQPWKYQEVPIWSDLQ
jgi:hypothetical protein